MNKIQLFFLLRRNIKLSEKRHPMFEANQYGKIIGYITVGFLAIEFIALGTFFGWMAAQEDTAEGIMFFMPFLLLLDFGMRFMTQQTPLMLVKPYLLMPVSKFTAIDCFLVRQLLDSGNLVWMTFFLPYTFIVWCGGMSTWAALGLLLLLHVMVLVNSQWYLLVRTLVNHHLLWWLLPAAFYGLTIMPVFFLSNKQIDKVANWIDHFIDNLGGFPTLLLALVVAVLFVALFAVNRYLQMHLIYDEIGKKGNTKLKHVSEFQSLNRFGQIGEYLKLEIKSTMRNKSVRGRFIQGMCFITFFSLMIAFTEVYNTSFERNFWCLYAFIFFGCVNLSMVMCPEGNYIDLLMVHEENTLTLLRAKYYFYCAILVLPLAFTLVPVFTGKFSIVMVLAYLFTATGPVYMLLFQMAVYNKMTLPLNEKLMGKNQAGNKWQSIVTMVAMFVPVMLVFTLQALFDEDVAYWVMLLIGVALTVAEPYWMRNIYHRMMRRRYQNLEGFHATR